MPQLRSQLALGRARAVAASQRALPPRSAYTFGGLTPAIVKTDGLFGALGGTGASARARSRAGIVAHSLSSSAMSSASAMLLSGVP